MESSFKWHEATITVSNTTVRTRMKINRLKRLANVQALQDEFEVELASIAMFYLGHVVKVDGNAGFTIPNGNANEETVQEFMDGFYYQDESLADKWDNAIVNARNITNDPDLLPPEDIDPNA